MPMWADGICINQNDDVEKSKQVAMIGEIYAGAHKTIIYLGPSENGLYKSPCLPIIASQVDDMQESGNEAGDSQESEHESQSDLLSRGRRIERFECAHFGMGTPRKALWKPF
jgi:hypothetical protein